MPAPDSPEMMTHWSKFLSRIERYASSVTAKLRVGRRVWKSEKEREKRMQKEGRKEREEEGERKLISTGTDMNTTAALICLPTI